MSSTRQRDDVRSAQSTGPSQLAPSTIGVRRHVVSRRSTALVALAALAAAVALALVMALGDGSSGSREAVAPSAAPALRSDGGPDESAVAAAVGTRRSSGTTGRPDGGPEESRTAASIARR